MSISRRRFLESAGLSTLAAQAAVGKAGMPMRVLGRTKARVSILGFGCGSRLLAYKEMDKGIEALNRGIDLGINYIDTAQSYGDGQSETWVGHVMKTRRKEVWLVTKVTERNGEKAMRLVEDSLKRLQTDHLDLIHVHGLGDESDLARVEAPDGLLKLLYKLRDQKVTRFVGVTCHQDPSVLKTALSRNDFDCTQMALNAARIGATPAVKTDPLTTSFEALALPVALKKNMGVTAMKIFAQEKLLGKAPIEKLLRYTMSLPVAAAVCGMPKLEYLEENIRIAKSFKPLPKSEMKVLSQALAERHKLALDRFFANHVDA